MSVKGFDLKEIHANTFGDTAYRAVNVAQAAHYGPGVIGYGMQLAAEIVQHQKQPHLCNQIARAAGRQRATITGTL